MRGFQKLTTYCSPCHHHSCQSSLRNRQDRYCLGCIWASQHRYPDVRFQPYHVDSLHVSITYAHLSVLTKLTIHRPRAAAVRLEGCEDKQRGYGMNKFKGKDYMKIRISALMVAISESNQVSTSLKLTVFSASRCANYFWHKDGESHSTSSFH
jgi:hypothetical protein